MHLILTGWPIIFSMLTHALTRFRSMRKYVTLFFFCLASTPLLAQTTLRGRITHQTGALAPVASSPQVLDYSMRLWQSPEGQGALQAFHQAKEAGLLPARKSARKYEIGQAKSFNVLINLQDPSPQWVAKTFELQSSNAVANVWVETSQLSVVSASSISLLDQALLSSTPEGSWNAAQGIIANDNEVFGNPPNFDGDGVVDILVYDVTEGSSAQSGVFILGFFTPTDIDINAQAGQGNQADILYLDTDPLITDPGRFGRDSTFVLITAAHEYQHLIHANYDLTESTFVNEAQSEWAEYMNGYEGRRITYLDDLNEHNTSFFEYRDSGLIDRQRGVFFHQYMSEQVGTLTVGSITRDPGDDQIGYNDVLGAETVMDLVADFHTANFLNDPGVGAKYGYQNPYLTDVHAPADMVFDGRTIGETPEAQFTLNNGGVQYLSWTDVQDFNLNLDAVADVSLLDQKRAQLRPRVILEHTDGTTEVQNIVPGTATNSFPGTYDRITAVVPHVQIGKFVTPVVFKYSATWMQEQTFTIEQISYDTGSSLNGKFVPLGSGVTEATRFTVPENGMLSKVMISPYYQSQFDGTTPGAKDFEFGVWTDDGTGQPGDRLFTFDFTDTESPKTFSCFTGGTCEANFITVDLQDHAAELSNLPDTIYVGITDTGSDANDLIIGVSPYSVENTSFLQFSSGNWSRLWDIRLQDAGGTVVDSLFNTTLLIRAEFSIPSITATEDVSPLPLQASLDQNYPNPFGPSTWIPYALARAEAVRLTVYDILGRRVATLVDGIRQAGRHEVGFEANGRASGLYFYTLETADRIVTRTMSLVK